MSSDVKSEVVDRHSSTQDSLDSFEPELQSKKDLIKQLKDKEIALTNALTEIACMKVQEVGAVAAGMSQNYSDKPVQGNIKVADAQFKRYGAAVMNQESLDELLPCNDGRFLGIIGENERFYEVIPDREQERLRTAKREQRRSTYEDGQVKKAQESNGSYIECVTRNIHLLEAYNKLKDQFDAYRGQILVLENDRQQDAKTHAHAKFALKEKIKQQQAQISILISGNNQLRQEKNLQTKESKNLEEIKRAEINVMSEKIGNLKEEKRAQAQEIIELQEKSKNSEENLLREKKEEKNAMMEKIKDLEEEIRTQAQEKVELQDKSTNSEENFLREKNALMEKIGDLEEERRAKAEEFQEKYESLEKTLVRESEEFKTTMHSKLDSVVAENNSLTEKIAEFLRQSKNSEENHLRENNALMVKIRDLEEERRAQAQEKAELHEKSKNSEENFLREKNALMEKIGDLKEERRAQAQEIAELHEKSKNSEENLLREKNALMVKIRDLEEERRAQAQEITELHEKLKIYEDCEKRREQDMFVMQQRVDHLTNEAEELTQEINVQFAARRRVESEKEEFENVIVSLRRKTTNQQKIIDANENRIDELENQNEQQKVEFDAENARLRAELDEVNAALVAARAEHDAEYAGVRAELNEVNAAGLQYSAEQGQAGRDDLQIIDDLRFYPPPRGAHSIAVEQDEWDDDADGDG